MAFEARRRAHQAFPPGGCQNLGLMVARHNQAIDDWRHAEHGAKDEALRLMAAFSMPEDAARAYARAYRNRQKAAMSGGDCETIVIESATRVLLGTGNASVFEFGFNLSHPWGVPYIPASSIKGLVSSYMARHGGGDWNRSGAGNAVKSEAQVELFGGVLPGKGGRGRSYVGSLRFFDAWLAPWDRRAKQGDWFDEDIITPHHQGYFAEKRPPDGTESPVPVKIAALRPGLRFAVTIQGSPEHRRLAKEALLLALAEEGIGGKTAVGYGRFFKVESQEELASGLMGEIEAAATGADLAALFKKGRNSQILAPEFNKALERLGYTPETKEVWEQVRPLAALARQVGLGEIAGLDGLIQAYKGLRKQIEHWQEAEGVAEIRDSPDGRELWKLVSEKWPGEAQKRPDARLVADLMPPGSGGEGPGKSVQPAYTAPAQSSIITAKLVIVEGMKLILELGPTGGEYQIRADKPWGFAKKPGEPVKIKVLQTGGDGKVKRVQIL